MSDDQAAWEARFGRFHKAGIPYAGRNYRPPKDEGEPDDDKKSADIKKQVEELRRSKGLPLEGEINLE